MSDKTYQVIITTMTGQTIIHTIKATDREHAIMLANEITPDTIQVYGLTATQVHYDD